MWQTDEAEEVEAEEEEDHDPEAEEYLTVEDAPAVCKVSYREELEGQCQLSEAENDLHHIEPAAALWHTLEHAWEECEQGEWQ